MQVKELLKQFKNLNIDFLIKNNSSYYQNGCTILVAINKINDDYLKSDMIIMMLRALKEKGEMIKLYQLQNPKYISNCITLLGSIGSLTGILYGMITELENENIKNGLIIGLSQYFNKKDLVSNICNNSLDSDKELIIKTALETSRALDNDTAQLIVQILLSIKEDNVKKKLYLYYNN